jgi:predicted PurR-regulated permease PerM
MPSPSLPDAEWRRRTSWLTARAAVVTAAALLLVYAFYFFLLAFAGILLAVFLSALANLLAEKTGLGRLPALGIVIGSLALLAGGAFWWIGPRVGSQMMEMTERLPAALQEFEAWLGRRAWGRTVLRHLPDTGESSTRANLLGRVTGFFSATLSTLLNVLSVLFLGVYLAAAPQLYRAGVRRLAPAERRARGGEIFAALGAALRGWLVGRIASMTVVAALTFAGLLALGVPLALSLAVIAGAFSFVPYVGPIAAAVPALLVAGVEGVEVALWVAALYAAVQLVESYLITPLIQQHVVSMAPALLISAQVLLGMAGGVLGVLLATPLAVVSVVLLQTLYVQDVLGEDVEVMGSSWNHVTET